MTSKRITHTRRSGRGRSGKRGLARIKAARLIPGRVATTQNPEENNDLYEDAMLYVKDQKVAPPKRGRPKKNLVQVPPRPDTPHVIYVPSVKLGAVPFMTAVRRPSQSAIGSILQPALKCVIQSATRQLANKTFVYTEAPKLKQEVDKEKFEWPDDLQDIADTWDSLPENNMREVVKWLQSPLTNTTYPETVANVHSLMEEWDEPMETKIEQIGAWWLEDHPSQTKVIPQTITSVEVDGPKVVVEAQPNPLQHCSQWSSMKENQENREP